MFLKNKDEYERIVEYQWTNDGEVEVCAIKEVVLQEERTCYHCNRKINIGETIMILKSQDGEEYIVCRKCYQKACKLI